MVDDSEYADLDDVWMHRGAILNRVWVHLNTLTVEGDTMLFLYSALELRFFIESLFFELLEHYRGGQLNRRDVKTYRPQDYCSLISQLEPAYITSAAEVLGVETLEENWLSHTVELYGRLGAYLHLPKQPLISEDHEQWKLGLEGLVIGAYEYFDSLTAHSARQSARMAVYAEQLVGCEPR